MKRLLRFLWRFLHRHKYVRLTTFSTSRTLELSGCTRCNLTKLKIVHHPPGCSHDLLFLGERVKVTYWRCIVCGKDWAENTNPEKTQWLEIGPTDRLSFEGDQLVIVNSKPFFFGAQFQWPKEADKLP